MLPLFQLSPGSLLKSGLGPLGRYCTHQDTTGETPEQKHLPSDQYWIGLERDHYSSWTRINAGGNAATIRVIPWIIIEVRPGVLGHKVGDMNIGIFLLTLYRDDLRRGHYSSLHAFVSSNCLSRQIKITTQHENPKRGANEKQVKRTLLG